MTSCLIFTGPSEQNVRVGSDTGFWSNVTHMLAEAEKMYASKLKQVAHMIRNRLVNNDVLNNSPNNKDYMKMTSVMDEMRWKLEQKYEAAEQVMHSLIGHQADIQRGSNQDRDKMEVRVAGHTYTDLRCAYRKQQKNIDKARQKYESAMRETERVNLCVLRTNQTPRKCGKTLQKVAEAEVCAKLAETMYREHVTTGNDSLRLLKSASRQYEESWRKQEIARTSPIIAFVQEYTSSCMNVNVQEMVDDLGERELEAPSEFKMYTNPVLSLVQSRLALEAGTPEQKRLEYTEYCEDKVQIGHVTRSFKQKDSICLQLKKGVRIVQLLPPTSEGWAFGEMCEGNKSPQYGFYPVCCVEYKQRFTCRRSLSF